MHFAEFDRDCNDVNKLFLAVGMIILILFDVHVNNLGMAISLNTV